MTKKELEAMLRQMEQEQKRTRQKMEGLRKELAEMQGEDDDADDDSDDSYIDTSYVMAQKGNDLREFILERGKHYFGNYMLLPEDADEAVNWLYEVTNGEVSEDEVVFILEDKSFSELGGMNRMLSALLPGAPLVDIDKNLLIFCEEALYVLEPGDEEYDLAAMFKYSVIKKIFRFEDGLHIDVTEDAEEYEDYKGCLSKLPEMEAEVTKHLPRLLLNLRDYKKRR